MSQVLAEEEVTPSLPFLARPPLVPSRRQKREKTAGKLLGLGRGCRPPPTQSQTPTVRWARSPPAGDLRSLRFSAAGLLLCGVTAWPRGLHRLIILLPHHIKVLQVPESQGPRDLQLIYTHNPTAEELEMPCLGRAQGHGANSRKHLSGGSKGCFMVSTRLINPTTPFLRCEE